MSALRRHSPLRRSTGGPTPSRSARSSSDRVTPELRAEVLRRDGACILYLLDQRHVCRDAWNVSHSPFATHKLSIEHVKDEPRMGVRGPSDLAHCVAMCYAANVAVPSKDQRVAIRAYLRGLYPEVAA